ncbi:MAG: right-handed parallel beta-helix repeat-containing protein [Casimicrobiaceae bacterium]
MKLLLLAAFVVTAVGAAWIAIACVDVPPRRLAPYVEQRSSGHDPAIENAGRFAAAVLVALDRGRPEVTEPIPVPSWRGTESAASATTNRVRTVTVGSRDEALHAIGAAEPGDAITFLPGTYRFDGAYIDVRQPGTPTAPISVRAEKPGTVVLEFNMHEGFLVSAPYWSFENLVIRGICADDSDCEHAFHVVAGAVHFAARDNEVVDFNAHFKVNGSGDAYPDFGVIEGNTLRNGSVRDTGNPVTLIDLVAASHWRIRGNRISDFVKGQSDRISYGAFVKGGGEDNRFERNVVVCEDALRGSAGQRVGLSLGGGGSSKEACRDHQCITEQDGGVIGSNLIISCSDDGIYLNRAAMSSITQNTLIDTGGITARFGESSADVDGNLVDGPIRAVADATLHLDDNIDTRTAALYLGWHPVRRLFTDPLALDLRWRGDPPRQRNVREPGADLCGMPRPRQPTYGAFEDIARCAIGN